MKMPLILAIVGAIVGVVVALALFILVFGGGSTGAQAYEPTPEPTVVHVPGKLGPHITMQDRIFNLRSVTPVYLKMQTIIEFETKDARWARVLGGCAAHPFAGGPLYVSAAPGGAGAVGAGTAGTESPKGSKCEAEEHALQAEIEEEIGTGRQLIEDAITTIVSGKSAEEISTPAGKEELKAEIRHAVEEILDHFHVTRVLFVNFITQ